MCGYNVLISIDLPYFSALINDNERKWMIIIRTWTSSLARAAMIVQRMLTCVRPSIYLSVTSRYSV